MNHEGTKDTKEHEGEKRRKRMIPMGNTLMKHGTMFDRVSKIFAGSRGSFYKKRPWPPEAIENKKLLF